MKRIKGNIIDVAEEGEYDVVLQGCNCQCTMGSGVAKDMANSWPEVRAADAATARDDHTKLGGYTHADIIRRTSKFTVYNLYTQHRYGPASEQHFDYDAFRCCLIKLRGAIDKKARILSPLIGCGTGGGRFRYVVKIFEEELGDFDVTLISI